MSYLGASTTLQTVAPGIDYFSGNGSTTTFQLSRQIVAVQDILVYIDNVPQNPSTAYSINTATNQITFTSAPLSGTNNIWVYYNTKTIQMLAPSQGTVGQAQMLNPTGTGSPVLASSPTLVTPTINQINNSVPGSSLGAGNASIMKNRIINGAMVIDQRNAGASVSNTTLITYSLDRWRIYGTQASKFTAQQNAGSVTPPAGFTNYLGVTSSSAYTIGSGEVFRVEQAIEGFNIADLGFGTANAKPITISFWVRSSLVGTFGGALWNVDASRSYQFSYSIPVANTWTQIFINVAGDTTGTWNTTNGQGLVVEFSMGAGSTQVGSAGSWGSTLYFGVTGQQQIVSTNGSTFYITGVQLEVGSSATGFEYRQYQQELALCQRYYWAAASGVNSAIAMGGYVNSTQIRTTVKFPVSMRTTPALAATSGTDYYGMYVNGGNDTFNSFTIYFPNTESAAIYNASESSGTAGQAGFVYTNNASASLAFSAEL